MRVSPPLLGVTSPRTTGCLIPVSLPTGQHRVESSPRCVLTVELMKDKSITQPQTVSVPNCLHNPDFSRETRGPWGLNPPAVQRPLPFLSHPCPRPPCPLLPPISVFLTGPRASPPGLCTCCSYCLEHGPFPSPSIVEFPGCPPCPPKAGKVPLLCPPLCSTKMLCTMTSSSPPLHCLPRAPGIQRAHPSFIRPVLYLFVH